MLCFGEHNFFGSLQEAERLLSKKLRIVKFSRFALKLIDQMNYLTCKKGQFLLSKGPGGRNFFTSLCPQQQRFLYVCNYLSKNILCVDLHKCLRSFKRILLCAPIQNNFVVVTSKNLSYWCFGNIKEEVVLLNSLEMPWEKEILSAGVRNQTIFISIRSFLDHCVQKYKIDLDGNSFEKAKRGVFLIFFLLIIFCTQWIKGLVQFIDGIRIKEGGLFVNLLNFRDLFPEQNTLFPTCIPFVLKEDGF